MKSTFLRMAAVALTAWLGFASGVAQAAVTDINPSWSGLDNGFFSGSKTGAFIDFFTFTLPSGSDNSGGASVIAGFTNKSNLTISEFELEDVSGLTKSQIQADSDANIIIETFPNSSTGTLSFSGLNNTSTYALEVEGNLANGATHGSFAGNVSVNPVPEPSTYAMLLAGLGLVGFSARRRMNNNA
jgi:PEP-CTERM motif